MYVSEKKYTKKIYIDKNLLKKIKRQCKKEHISLNAYLILQIQNLVVCYERENLFFTQERS